MLSSTPRIDSHHHFWDPGRAEYPFLTAELAAIRRPYGPDDLRHELEAEGIDGTVLVQTRSSIEETRELLLAAERESFVAGVVGWVDLTVASVADDIDALRGEPGGDRLVGIRHQVHDEPDPDWLRRPDVRRGLLAVQEAGLAYDLLVRARELPAAADTVRALPSLRFVLDHLAKPPIADGDLSAWAPGILALADLPNVSAKISGLVTEADWRSWSLDDLRGPVEIAVDAFGADRLMIGSDWPVCLLAGAYPEVLGAMRALLDELPVHDLDRILGGTAIDAYRLAVPR
jgi:L-fuconolactonase